ncbi:MAG TPA: UDP-N-acetylglucosamine 2-epimerase (non-hydrolyzing) [Ferruginibacter sp.]|nr:UDP-N-acetylglucosamine 2-epimerase (non-hydrolyzing) [Ferruginibacter sp.]
MKIFSIVGARPQFIKLAPLSAALIMQHQEFIVHTGQHYDYVMSQKIFDDLGIRKPDIHLEVGSGNQTVQLTEMMLKLESAMIKEKPDLVIVFGDTNSTLAGALISAKLCIPILHIEAGLRSFNRSMPEEINRIVTDHVSKYLFAPTQTAIDNLKNEGLAAKTYLTGDIMVDTMKNNIATALKLSAILDRLKLENKTFSLLTLHRHYNVDDNTILEHILTQLGQLGERIIFPMHPRTKKMLSSTYIIPSNIEVIEPLGYLDFIALENSANRIITDSGGIQKEAYILKKQCITLRTETEWVETVEEKWNLLVNPLSKNITEQIIDFKTALEQHEIFGANVTDKMVGFINSIK